MEELKILLKKFGNKAQKEDVDLEELAEEYGLEIEEVELQNAFVYDYIIVRVSNNKKYKINFNDDGFVTSVEEL